ncbi:MAG: hypothetical protein IPG64_22005 [Haliea sp.]|nr:hypothetical protein [Haliea sp.]
MLIATFLSFERITCGGDGRKLRGFSIEYCLFVLLNFSNAVNISAPISRLLMIDCLCDVFQKWPGIVGRSGNDYQKPFYR